MDLSKLTKADRILFGAGIVFMISTFLTWFSVSILGVSAGANAWDVGFLWGRLPFFISLVLLVWIGLARFSTVKLPDEIPALYLAGGGLVALLPILKLLIGEDAGGLSVDRGFGLVVAVVAGVGVAFGGFLKFQEAGGDIDELKSQIKSTAEGLGGDKKPDA